MTKIQYLRDQAARADRLARLVIDSLTVERLQDFAADCRVQAETLSAAQPSQTALQGYGPVGDQIRAA